MSFTQFNRAGHKTLSAEITRELQDLGSRLGLDISAAGGTIGETELVVKIVAKTNDRQAIEESQKSDFRITCSRVGLKPDDYGLEFKYANSRFRLTGVKPSRPKYPILGYDLRKGTVFKLPTSAIPAIESARAERDALAAATKSITGTKIEEEGRFESEWA